MKTELTSLFIYDFFFIPLFFKLFTDKENIINISSLVFVLYRNKRIRNKRNTGLDI